MKLYFLLEGQESEVALYPFWLSKLVPTLRYVDSFNLITDNTYCIYSGYGYPSMIKNNHILNSIQEINRDGTFDYFVICLDSDSKSVSQRKGEIEDYLVESNLSLSGNCQLIILIQNPCIETWLLGNREVYPKKPQNKNFVQHQLHYNVSVDDPELMPKHPNYKLPISRYHAVHLIEMLKPYIRYSKSNAKGVMTDEYFTQLLKRIEETPSDIVSFKQFLNFCDEINKRLIENI